MKMELANKETKSMLAKLLASENITVEHGKYNTASFDVKNRVLRLPIWKEMSGNLYDLLVLHEVGHALFTPEEGMHDAKGYGKGFKSFLNVVEDARIERKIKVKYPGGRRAFINGYADLMNRDFFGINKMNCDKLLLIDKINLHYKVGDHVELSFTDEERIYLDRIDKANTWKEVVKICKDLYDNAIDEEESSTDKSDHDWDEENDSDCEGYEDFDDEFDDDSGDDYDESDEKENDSSGEESDEESNSSNSEDSDEESEDTKAEDTSGKMMSDEGGYESDFGPESETDNNFRNKESELVSDDSKPYRYLNVPNNIDIDKIVINFKELYKEYDEFFSERVPNSSWHFSSSSTQIEEATKRFREFRSKNKKIVEYLAKEFEMKKAADEHARAATANSGILDSERLHTYKYNEHLFKKLTVLPNGKNHGLVMFVDWSGSMHSNMKGTIEQMMTLVMFCKRVNIPFEVYAFSDSYIRNSSHEERTENTDYDSNGYLLGEKIRTYGTLAVNRFKLLNLFSSRMKAKEMHNAFVYMTITAAYYDRAHRWRYDAENVEFNIPSKMMLGGTPLNVALYTSFPILRDFVKKNQVEVINSIFLTDGDSHSCNNYWVSDTECKNFDPRSENIFIRDSVSKKEVRVSASHRSCRAVTEAMINLYRSAFNINIVNFYIVSKMRRWDLTDYLLETGVAYSEENITKALKDFRKDKYIIASNYRGFNEEYRILGGKNLEVQEASLEVAEGASVAQMARAFKKFSTGKIQQRKLLSRFIDMIAA